MVTNGNVYNWTNGILIMQGIVSYGQQIMVQTVF